jgi:hypothetical protein
MVNDITSCNYSSVKPETVMVNNITSCNYSSVKPETVSGLIEE